MPLVIVPTPVGNLGDMTLRGLEALRSCDVIAAEDTRRTLKLLNHYGIRKPLVSYHRHNERDRATELLERVERGDTVALVSDAGTPGISDPGGELISGAIARGLQLDVLPGANAILPAILLSGVPCGKFFFFGFPDRMDSAGRDAISRLAGVEGALVFCVAPHDLARSLDVFARIFGDRRAAVVREISKVHQEAIRGRLSELADAASGRVIKGELMVVVEGASGGSRPEGDDSPDWRVLAFEMKRAGIFDKEIANVLFASYGIPRNAVKNFLLQEAAKK